MAAPSAPSVRAGLCGGRQAARDRSGSYGAHPLNATDGLATPPPLFLRIDGYRGGRDVLRAPILPKSENAERYEPERHEDACDPGREGQRAGQTSQGTQDHGKDRSRAEQREEERRVHKVSLAAPLRAWRRHSSQRRGDVRSPPRAWPALTVSGEGDRPHELVRRPPIRDRSLRPKLQT